MQLSKQQEQQLWEEYNRTGNKTAKKKLLKSLRPLIQQRVNQFTNSGLPKSSLELEGMRLASQAIETYDPLQAQLNTHITNYLKKLSRFTTTYQNVGHIPEPRALILGRYQTIYSNLQAEKGREPTISELADNMNLPEAEIERIQSEDRKDLSIDLTSADDEGGFFFDIDPAQQTTPAKKAWDYLYFDSDPVDKKILEYNFGIGNNEKLTFSKIKSKLNLSDTELKKRKEFLAKEFKDLMDLNG